MADTSTLLSFGFGKESNLPSTQTDGKIYITSDTKRMFVDLPGMDRLCLSNFEIIEGPLPPDDEVELDKQFYIHKSTNSTTKTEVFKLYAAVDGTLKEIVNTDAFATLSAKVAALEQWKTNFSSEVAQTYLAKAGGEMTGTITMKQPTGTTNKVTVTGLPNPSADSDAANKAYVDTKVGEKADKDHASTTTDFGVGNATNYGHLKLSNSTKSDSGVDGGVAATPAAVKSVQDALDNLASTVNGIDLTPYVKHDGTVVMTGNLNLGSKKIINVADPEEATDAATMGYIDGIIGDSTTAGTIKKSIADIEASLGSPTTTGKADGTAYERIAKNANDIAGHASRLTATETVANAAVTPAGLSKALESYVTTTGLSATLSSYDTVASVNQKFTNLKNGSTSTLKDLDNAISGLSSDLEELAGDIGNLSNVMNFIGITTTKLEDGKATGPKIITINNAEHTAAAGDVVIYDGKEFVCVAITTGGAQWNLIGDTSANSTAISELQERMDDAEENIDNIIGDLGTNDDSSTTAFARIKDLEDVTSTQSSAIVELGQQLTWTSFDS